MNSSQPKYYAGIGSRKTPPEERNRIREIALELNRQGYTLRSGGADGADTYFEEGATKKEIFLPWDGFNKRPISKDASPGATYFQGATDAAVALAQRVIDGFEDRNVAVRMILARNMHQVLGEDLRTPVEFVVCWTPEGKVIGGTGHAIKLARSRGIPVYNLARPSDVAKLRKKIFQVELF